MSNGSRIWLVNFTHAVKTTAADDTHPLHCNDDGDSYRCQWYMTTNARDWSDYQKLRLGNVTNIPSFFVVSKALMSREALTATLAKERKGSLAAGQAASRQTADW